MAPLTIFAVALMCATAMMVGTTGSMTGDRPGVGVPGGSAAPLINVPRDALASLVSPFLRLMADARDTLVDVRREMQEVGQVLSPSRR